MSCVLNDNGNCAARIKHNASMGESKKQYFGIWGNEAGAFGMHAQNFLEAANMLAPNMFIAARYVLLCHALELALKAYILSAAERGGARPSSSDVTLRPTKKLLRQRPFRHHLLNLWSKAIELGYEPDEQNPEWLGELTSLVTDEMELRYPDPATVYELPSPEQEQSLRREIARLVLQSTL